MVVLLLCRHGETQANADGRVQGQGLDAPLNEVGESQAKAMGHALRDVPIHAAYSSQLVRSSRTVQLVMASRDASAGAGAATFVGGGAAAATAPSGLRVPSGQLNGAGAGAGSQQAVSMSMAALNEMNYGSLEAQLIKDVRPELARISKAWALGDVDLACPDGGESPRDVLTRAEEALAGVARRHGPDETILLVTHSRLNVVLLSSWALNLSQMHKVKQDNCCVNVVRYEKGAFQVVATNLNASDVAGSLSESRAPPRL